MSRVLVLGATGRAGSAITAELAVDHRVVAAVRTASDIDRLPTPRSDDRSHRRR